MTTKPKPVFTAIQSELLHIHNTRAWFSKLLKHVQYESDTLIAPCVNGKQDISSAAVYTELSWLVSISETDRTENEAFLLKLTSMS